MKKHCRADGPCSSIPWHSQRPESDSAGRTSELGYEGTEYTHLINIRDGDRLAQSLSASTRIHRHG